ncbi:MAG: DNA polymerase I [Clostridiales bacterium]|jgi:DNA polymerase-1|nr:DNA polymerase I [Clostridiales bacterium]
MEKTGEILLIDGNSILNRAFYAMPSFTNKDGEYTGAVYGFLNILLRTLEKGDFSYLAAAFDVKAKTFRHKMFPEYKGTRRPQPPELTPQFGLLKALLAKMNIKTFELPGFEADDLLGTLAAKASEAGLSAVILSGDRDMLQLASDRVLVRIPKTKGGKTVNEDYWGKDVEERLGVTPRAYIDVKALMGDSSDNIPGVPGIGEKTAVKLIREFGDLETALANAADIPQKKLSENLRQYAEQARQSFELSKIVTDVPIDFNLEETRLDSPFNEDSFNEIARLGFRSLLEKFRPEAELPAEILEKKEAPPPAPGNSEVITEITRAKEAAARFLGYERAAVSVAEAEGELLGLALAAPGDRIFIKLRRGLTDEGLSETDFWEAVKPFFEGKARKTLLNLKKYASLLKKRGILLKNADFDAHLAAYVLDGSKSFYDYGDLSFNFLNESHTTLPEIIGKGRGKKKLSEIGPEEISGIYMKNAEILLRVEPLLREALERNGLRRLYYEIELPLAEVLADMELTGIAVSAEELNSFGSRVSADIQRLVREIHELAGEEFNINSPAQLGVILFEKMGLRGPGKAKKTQAGYSTSADTLEKIAGKDPIVGKVLEYRTLTKLKSTYADGLSAVIREDGKIHSSFNQTAASTGRISSSEPNLQNIPVRSPLGRELRRAFIPSRPDSLLMSADYSQIELRVLAHMAGDPALADAFRNNMDIHRLTASQVFRVPFESVTGEQRSRAKAVNFGIIYGMSAFSLADGLRISSAEADNYIKGYFEAYPKIKAFLDGAVESARRTGSAVTIFGRRRPIPELSSRNFHERSFGERAAMNAPVQGSAADIIKTAMVRVHAALSARGLKSRLILQIHDELLLEARRDELAEAESLLREEMENCVALSVPLPVDIYYGDSWYDTK